MNRLTPVFATCLTLVAQDTYRVATPVIPDKAKLELKDLTIQFLQAKIEMDRLQALYQTKYAAMTQICNAAALELSPTFECVAKPKAEPSTSGGK